MVPEFGLSQPSSEYIPPLPSSLGLQKGDTIDEGTSGSLSSNPHDIFRVVVVDIV